MAPVFEPTASQQIVHGDVSISNASRSWWMGGAPSQPPASSARDKVQGDRPVPRGHVAPRRSAVAPELQDELAPSQGDNSDEGTVEPGVPPADFLPIVFWVHVLDVSERGAPGRNGGVGAYRRQASQTDGEATARMVWRRESAGGPLTVTLGEVGHVSILGRRTPRIPMWSSGDGWPSWATTGW